MIRYKYFESLQLTKIDKYAINMLVELTHTNLNLPHEKESEKIYFIFMAHMNSQSLYIIVYEIKKN